MISDTPKSLDREHSTRSNDPGFVSLLGDIVTDFQRLVKQHLALFKHEVREDVKKSKRAVATMVSAYMLGWLGGILLSAMLVGLLAWAFPQLPWWGWAGVAGAIACLAGWAMCASAKKMFAAITPLPDQTAQAIKEDIQWLKK